MNDQEALDEVTEALSDANAAIKRAAEALDVELADNDAPTMNDALRAPRTEQGARE